MRYTVRIKGARVTVRAYEGEDDYTVEVERVFARFREGAAESHLVNVPDSGSMDHVEARIAELVSRLFPAEFNALAEFCEGRRGFVDSGIARFDREVQFYIAYLDYMQRIAAAGLPFCYPTITAEAGEISAGRRLRHRAGHEGRLDTGVRRSQRRRASWRGADLGRDRSQPRW